MSAMLPFSETRKAKLPDWTGQMRSGVIGTIVGILLFYIAVTVFIPSDTYSTARWFDGLNVNQAISGTVDWFSLWNPVPVSREGFFFSVFVSVANLALAYQAAFGGYWFEGDENSNLFTVVKYAISRQGGNRKVNTVKLAYFAILVALTVFETMTGMEFRQRDETWAGAFKAGAVAFVVENAGSDWALTGGIGMILAGVIQVYDAWVMGRNDIMAISSALKRNGQRPQATANGSQANPQGKTQNMYGGGGKPSPGYSPHQHGGGGGGQQQRQGQGNGHEQPRRQPQQPSPQRPPVNRNVPATEAELAQLFEVLGDGGSYDR